MLDPDGSIQRITVDLTVEIEIKSQQKEDDAAITGYIREAPIMIGEIPPEIFEISKKESNQLLTVDFANPLALASEQGNDNADSEDVNFDGLEVRLKANDLLTSLTLLKVDYKSGGLGFATAYLGIDGTKSEEDFTTKAS